MAVLEQLLPGGVVSREVDLACLAQAQRQYMQEQLGPNERRATERALPRRRLQYAVTRHLARECFGQMGLARCELLNASDRSPQWPSGVVGSLSHTDAWCGVAASVDPSVKAVGIDAERDAPLSVEVAKRVLTPKEIGHLRAACASNVSCEELFLTRAKLSFSAKEAVYKCQYSITKTYLGFRDVELEWDWHRQRFSVAAAAKCEGVLSELRGAFGRGTGHWVTAAWVGLDL